MGLIGVLSAVLLVAGASRVVTPSDSRARLCLLLGVFLLGFGWLLSDFSRLSRSRRLAGIMYILLIGPFGYLVRGC